MALAAVTKGELSRAYAPDALIELYELDYSEIVNAPRGTAQHMRYFVPDSVAGAQVLLGGQPYDPFPVTARGLSYSQGDSPARPKLEVANGNALISALIASIGGDLTGAWITRRRIFRRHLDDGDDPDPLAQWEPDLWRVERVVSENRFFMEFDLSSPLDIEGVDLPLRRVEYDVCPWVYLSTECGWVNTSGPWFDREDNPVGSIGLDVCGLRLRSCRFRFETTTGILRFGGFPGAARIVR